MKYFSGPRIQKINSSDFCKVMNRNELDKTTIDDDNQVYKKKAAVFLVTLPQTTYLKVY